MKIYKNNQAFTLIEIVIVVTIILVVGGLVVPGIINFQAYQVEDTVVTNFVSSLRTYQNIAMTKDIKTKILRDVNKISFCEYSILDGVETPSCTKELDLTDSTAELWLSNQLGDEFYFDKYGNLINASGSLIENKEIYSKNFIITLTKNGSITKKNRQ